MNGISKESFVQAEGKLKDELLFDMIKGLYDRLEDHVTSCPVRKSINRLWVYALGLPSTIGIIIVIVKFMG